MSIARSNVQKEERGVLRIELEGVSIFGYQNRRRSSQGQKYVVQLHVNQRKLSKGMVLKH